MNEKTGTHSATGSLTDAFDGKKDDHTAWESAGVAEGREFRFDVGDLHGCVLRHNERDVHLYASRVAKKGGKG